MRQIIEDQECNSYLMLAIDKQENCCKPIIRLKTVEEEDFMF